MAIEKNTPNWKPKITPATIKVRAMIAPQKRMPRRNEKSFRVKNTTAVSAVKAMNVTAAALEIAPGAILSAMKSSGTKMIASATTKAASAAYWAGLAWARWAVRLASQETIMNPPSTNSHEMPISALAIVSANPVRKKNTSISVNAITAPNRWP